MRLRSCVGCVRRGAEDASPPIQYAYSLLPLDLDDLMFPRFTSSAKKGVQVMWFFAFEIHAMVPVSLQDPEGESSKQWAVGEILLAPLLSPVPSRQTLNQMKQASPHASQGTHTIAPPISMEIRTQNFFQSRTPPFPLRKGTTHQVEEKEGKEGRWKYLTNHTIALRMKRRTRSGFGGRGAVFCAFEYYPRSNKKKEADGSGVGSGPRGGNGGGGTNKKVFIEQQHRCPNALSDFFSFEIGGDPALREAASPDGPGRACGGCSLLQIKNLVETSMPGRRPWRGATSKHANSSARQRIPGMFPAKRVRGKGRKSQPMHFCPPLLLGGFLPKLGNILIS
eukprot:CAMPEP_0183327388 /NCGR_PEP_ID=MMETSP0160_2-20130417/83737_1 /TAXON_ID=2839 ORGANISM="Odontella Sinensis, Strain Grunow 1884" /NCGR_SAMPLE_ID=MMETSP0160_2 /ASSEMBLY_ACC=CAM_ASM_000250 /LENGTH=336 /DNA_ID=CAMNT_0025495513 /DNA_START=497 /DNA_END=1508 /DNA_ORIENTATION=-